jgi:hypothetical protein
MNLIIDIIFININYSIINSSINYSIINSSAKTGDGFCRPAENELRERVCAIRRSSNSKNSLRFKEGKPLYGN